MPTAYPRSTTGTVCLLMKCKKNFFPGFGKREVSERSVLGSAQRQAQCQIPEHSRWETAPLPSFLDAWRPSLGINCHLFLKLTYLSPSQGQRKWHTEVCGALTLLLGMWQRSLEPNWNLRKKKPKEFHHSRPRARVDAWWVQFHIRAQQVDSQSYHASVYLLDCLENVKRMEKGGGNHMTRMYCIHVWTCQRTNW